MLIEGLLQADVTLRHRVIASLNKLHDVHPEVRIDEQLVELVLAAEIAGHYRSYQVLGPLRAQLKRTIRSCSRHAAVDGAGARTDLPADGAALPRSGLHDAYVGVRSANPTVRANALEFLDNVLKPELRRLLVPLLDSQVTVDERIAIANQLVGAPLETAEQAVSDAAGERRPMAAIRRIVWALRSRPRARVFS